MFEICCRCSAQISNLPGVQVFVDSQRYIAYPIKFWFHSSLLMLKYAVLTFRPEVHWQGDCTNSSLNSWCSRRTGYARRQLTWTTYQYRPWQSGRFWESMLQAFPIQSIRAWMELFASLYTDPISGNQYNILVRLDQDFRNQIEDLKQLTITTANGQQVLLGNIATIEKRSGPRADWSKVSAAPCRSDANAVGRDLEAFRKIFRINSINWRCHKDLK